MKTKIKQKEATAIINSLEGGVVPKIGIQHITVGRNEEVKAFTRALEDVKDGHSIVKFWIGDYGSGKSFMMHLLTAVALSQKFVVSNADFTPTIRLYANDGKSLALYTSIMDNLSIQVRPKGGALPTLLQRWIDKVIDSTAKENNIPIMEIREEKYISLIQESIMKTINAITEVGGFDFGYIINKYYEGYISGNELLCKNALKWLKGEYTTKTEARQDLNVRSIITDQNYYDMLKNFCKLFVSMGYSGFMINLDEAINLYKISQSTMREKNYEKLLSIYNDCFQGKVEHLFINFAGTKHFLEDERRGLFSYNALKTRLEVNKYETSETRDYAQPVIRLMPLTDNEIFILLDMLKRIFDLRYKVSIDFSNDDIVNFMNVILNKPGASEFLTPRDVIRDFLNILNLLRQNPNSDKASLFEQPSTYEKLSSEDFLLDSIEEL